MGTLDRYLDGSMAADLVDKPGFEAVEVADAVSRALLRDWGLSIARGGARPEVKAYVPVLGRVKPRRFPGARRPRDPLPAPARAAAPLRSWAPWADEGATGGEPDDVEDVPLSALRARISASRAAQAPAAAAAKGAGGPAADENAPALVLAATRRPAAASAPAPAPAPPAERASPAARERRTASQHETGTLREARVPSEAKAGSGWAEIVHFECTLRSQPGMDGGSRALQKLRRGQRFRFDRVLLYVPAERYRGNLREVRRLHLTPCEQLRQGGWISAESRQAHNPYAIADIVFDDFKGASISASTLLRPRPRKKPLADRAPPPPPQMQMQMQMQQQQQPRPKAPPAGRRRPGPQEAAKKPPAVPQWAAQRPAAARPQSFECPICAADIGHMGEVPRKLHVNSCLENLEKGSARGGAAPAPADLEGKRRAAIALRRRKEEERRQKALATCPLCNTAFGPDVSSSARTAHIQSCADTLPPSLL